MPRVKSKTTAEVRKASAQGLLKQMGQQVYTDLDSGVFPSFTFPSRSVRNIVYDKKLQQFILGTASVKRSSSNIKHIRPFTQLLWLAYFSKKLVDEKRTSTLRDVYYSAQAFNVEFMDQAESDELITDLEALMSMAREGFNIYPEERSAIFGNMTIGYTVPGYEGKRLDLSAHPDGVMIGPALTTAEFVKTDAKMVLAIEKGGLFTRFIEEKVHERFGAILINTAGQPPRSTRYLLRRLNQELKLPVGILTDSVVGDEPILVRSGSSAIYTTLGEFVDTLFGYTGSGDAEWKIPNGKNWKCMAMNSRNQQMEWMPITCVYRHKAEGQLYEVELDDGRTIKTTKDHSLFTLRAGIVTPASLSSLSEGDYVVVPHRLPSFESIEPPTFDLLGGLTADSELVERNGLLFYPRTPSSGTPRYIPMNEDLAWVLGFWIAEGSYSGGRYIDYSQSTRNSVKAAKLVQKIQGAFGIKPSVRTHERENTTEIRVTIGRKVLVNFFQRTLGIRQSNADGKEVPAIVWQLPRGLQLAFVRGLLEGDGHIDDDSKETMLSTKSPKLAGQVSYLLFSLGLSNTIKCDKNNQFAVYLHGYNARALAPWLPVESFPELFKVSGFGLFQRPEEKISYARVRPRVNAMLKTFQEVAETGKPPKGRISYLIEKGYVAKSRGEYNVTARGKRSMALLIAASNLLAGDLHPVRIRRITPLRNDHLVYDLTVEGGHSFVAGQFCTLVHNSDPWGAHIAMVIKSGSANSAHLRELTTPDAVWLGVWASDIVKYKLPSDKLTEVDIKRLYELKEDPRYTDKMWHDELDMFLKIKKKSEQEAFSRYGLSYIVDTYLPEKLKLMKGA